jgi:phage regulator Rha-like protein
MSKNKLEFSLVLMKDGEPSTTSLIVARELKRLHKNITYMIEEYKNDFEEFGKIGDFENVQRHGKPTKIYYLNEQHLTFLIMMLRVKKNENDMVLNFKKRITKEFCVLRKKMLNLSMQKANQEWLEVRKKGKASRLKQTDVLKLFSEYAVNQGSNGYKKENQVYITFTKLENNSLFVIDKLIVKDLKKKKQSLRDLLNINQLDEIKQADEIILKALIDGMNKEMFYKDIYKLAKKRVETFVELKGKSVVPSIEFGYLEGNIKTPELLNKMED